MMKKALLTVSSVALLAACSSVPGNGDLAQGTFVTGTTTSGTVLMPDTLSQDPFVSEMNDGAPSELVDLRKDFIRRAGDRVHFGFDSASLDAEAQESLRDIAKFIKKNEGRVKSITIEGHCDERGTREYNLALGDRRAVSAKKYLVGLGIDAAKINTISYGKERPVDPRHTDSAWQRNRRAVVVLN